MMCAGEFHPMKIDIRPGDWVIAVDGGLKYLELCGIEPDFLLGDFDSLGEEYAETVAKYRAMGEEHFRQLPVVKDDTDTMAAARLGIQGVSDLRRNGCETGSHNGQYPDYGLDIAQRRKSLDAGQRHQSDSCRSRHFPDTRRVYWHGIPVRTGQISGECDDPRNEV